MNTAYSMVLESLQFVGSEDQWLVHPADTYARWNAWKIFWTGTD
jgi:hypothetical protein